jgi:hypothetical protein
VSTAQARPGMLRATTTNATPRPQRRIRRVRHVVELRRDLVTACRKRATLIVTPKEARPMVAPCGRDGISGAENISTAGCPEQGGYLVPCDLRRPASCRSATAAAGVPGAAPRRPAWPARTATTTASQRPSTRRPRRPRREPTTDASSSNAPIGRRSYVPTYTMAATDASGGSPSARYCRAERAVLGRPPRSSAAADGTGAEVRLRECRRA